MSVPRVSREKEWCDVKSKFGNSFSRIIARCSPEITKARPTLIPHKPCVVVQAPDWWPSGTLSSQPWEGADGPLFHYSQNMWATPWPGIISESEVDSAGLGEHVHHEQWCINCLNVNMCSWPANHVPMFPIIERSRHCGYTAIWEGLIKLWIRMCLRIYF